MGLAIACLIMAAPLKSYGLVRYGKLVNTGNIVARFSPGGLQHLDEAANQYNWYQLNVDSYTRYAGLDRLTLANQIRAYWDEHNAFASTAKLRLSNDVYISILANLDVGVGVSWQYLNDNCATQPMIANGYQYRISMRWQW